MTRPLTGAQRIAFERIAGGRCHLVSVERAKQLTKRGLIKFVPTLSKTGRVTSWTATLTGAGKSALYEIQASR